MNPAINPQARYEGAAQGRRLASWNPPSSGAISATSPAIPTLRNRCRDLVRNDAIAAAAIRVLTNSIVGFGIECRSTSTDLKAKQKLSDAWRDWTKTASTCGADFAGLQVLVTRALFTDGECFLRITPRKPEQGRATPFQLMPLEADMLPLLDADNYVGLPEGNRIVQGIEIDSAGRRVAYWFHKSHPGERMNALNMPGDLIRVPADEVMHVADFQRIGQMRGVSPLASTIVRLKNVSDYDDAVLERMKLANLFVGFVRKPLPSGAADVMTGLPYEGSPDTPISGLEPGAMQELLPGEEVTFSTPPDAGAAYVEFMRSQYQAIGAAVGVPPEMLTGELRDISDRTLRFAVGEFRRRVDQIVWTCLVPRFLQPTREAFGLYARIAGVINEREHTEVSRCTWAIPAQAPIHPLQDLSALKLAVDNGFKSRAAVIAGFGDDPAQVDSERADDKARAADLGLQSPEDKLADAELKKLIAEADAAQRTADAAKAKAGAARAAMTEAHARTETVEATRPHQIATAQATAKAAKVELQAAELGLAELKGAKL